MRYLLFLLILFCSLARGQTSFLRFSNEGIYRCFSYSLQFAADGGYVQAGTQEGNPLWSVYIEKFDTAGNSLWKTLICPPNLGVDCEIHSGIQTSDGGFLFTGWSFNAATADQDIFLLKTDSHGTYLWSKNFDMPSDQWALKILKSSVDPNIYIAGRTFELGNADFLLLKTDLDGNLLLNLAIANLDQEYCQDAMEIPGIGILLVGSYRNLGFYLNMKLLHYDGTIAWEQKDTTEQLGEVLEVARISDSKFAIVGQNDYDSYLRVYDTSGTMLWHRDIDFSGHKLWLTSVDATANQEIWVTGITKIAIYQDVFVAKYDDAGNELLQTTYDLGGEEYPEAIRSCPDGGAAITGYNLMHAFLLKLFEDGTLPAPEIAQPTTDIRILPNPSRGAFQVQLPAPGAYNFQLFDVQGKMIYTAVVDSDYIVEQQLPPGMYFGTWVRADGAAFSAKILIE